MNTNILVFSGNLGNDPEMRYTPQGDAVTSFSVACNREWKDSDGNKNKETTWYRCSAWRGRAEVCHKYLSKGSKVLITGRLHPDKNTGGPRVWAKTDGTHAASFEVTIDSIEFLSSHNDQATSGAYQDNQLGGGVPDDDIPF